MHYCEELRAIDGFEPWNATTNAGFLLAAVWGFVALRRAGLLTFAGPRWLVALAVAIGLGSFAWHATGAAWAQLADVLPILGFVLVFLGTALTGLFGCSTRVAVAACVALVVTAALAGFAAGGALNGSVAYLPVWGGLLALTVIAGRQASPARYQFALATLLFAVSLGMRTADLRLCAATVIGTHFLWHLLNAALIALLISAIAGHHRGRLGRPESQAVP